MKTPINIYFHNSHTEALVARITFKSRKHSSFNAMLPFFNKEQDKWIIGKQYGYLCVGDQYHFYYAGRDKKEAQKLANQAYEQACATLGLEVVA
jgi:hypothetical protein